MLDRTLVILLIVGGAVLILLGARRWSADTSTPDSRPPSALDVLARRVTRFQLQRPALLPAVVAVAAIVVAALLRQEATPAKDLAALQGMSGAYAGGMLTIFTLLAGLTAGFTFTVIGTMGSTFTPLLADPAIRAPRFWWFLAFSTAGMVASAWLLLMPPVAVAELAVTLVCLVGSIVTLTVYLRGVALDANPATLLRRLTDNDVPPAGFKTFARGRPVQIGLAVVRAALQRRDGPIAAAATYEVVRACAHFQRAMLSKPVKELGDPRLNWGPEYIAEVQGEFRQWIDELNDDSSAPASAYDSAGRLLAYPLVWESTLHARLGIAGAGGEAATTDPREDLEQPLHELLATSGPDGEPEDDDPPLALRVMTMKTAAFAGALNTIHAAQVHLAEGASASPEAERLSTKVARELAEATVRLASRHGGQLARVPATGGYATRLIRTTQEPIARQVAAIVTLGGYQAEQALRDALEKTADANDTGAPVFAAALTRALDTGTPDPMTTEDAAEATRTENEQAVA